MTFTVSVHATDYFTIYCLLFPVVSLAIRISLISHFRRIVVTMLNAALITSLYSTPLTFISRIFFGSPLYLFRSDFFYHRAM